MLTGLAGLAPFCTQRSRVMIRFRSRFERLECTREAMREPPVQVLTSAELALLARPPADEFPGYEVSDFVRFGVEPGTTPPTGKATVRVGAIVDSGVETGNWLTLPLRDLSKHVLIAGVTGSGKTNTCFGLLEQVWDGGRGVPFLVVESAKSEYRSLLAEPGFRGLTVFTVGDETTSPLRINPFEVPPGILVQTHIDYLKSLFSAAFVLYPPMPYVLEQAALRDLHRPGLGPRAKLESPRQDLAAAFSDAFGPGVEGPCGCERYGL